MDWIGLIVFISYMASFVVLLFAFIRLRLMYNSLMKTNYKNEFEKELVTNKLYKLLQEQSANDVEKTDGFLKFISESRDWAFKYIEDVQKAITDYNNSVGTKEKREAYKKLLTFLPEENNSPEHD